MKTPILSEANFQAEMDRILPLLKKMSSAGTFERIKGETIHYELFQKEGNTAWVAISHGFTENILKYSEVIWYFLSEGYNVAMVDHRGHGRSFRAVPNTWLTHVDRFEDYSDDFCYFIQNIVEPVRKGLPIYLMSHSMGGAVAAHVLERFPELPFEKAILGCPMICPKTEGIPKWVTLTIARFFCLIGKGKECVFAHKPYTPKSDFGEPSCCASSKSRHHWYWGIQQTDDLTHNCAASYQWLRESLVQYQKVMKQANIDRIRVPVLLLQAGKDNSVENEAQDAFLAKLKGAKKAVFPDALHEVFRGSDKQVEEYMNTILNYFEV